MVQKCASLFLVRAPWARSDGKGYRDRDGRKEIRKKCDRGSDSSGI